MIRSLVAATLVISLGSGPCLAQSARYSPPLTPGAPPPPQSGGLTPLNDLMRSARAGDSHAAYLVGRAFETGVGAPWQRPNIEVAVGWYQGAMNAGNLNATYRLGYLISQGKVLTTGAHGVMRRDPSRGNDMMQFALNRGYSPATDSVGTLRQTPQPAQPVQNEASKSSSLTGGEVLGGLLLLGLVAAALSGDSSDSPDKRSDSSQHEDTRASRTCTVFYDAPITPNPTYPGTTSERRSRTGYGYECP